jgi:hypothetical protein
VTYIGHQGVNLRHLRQMRHLQEGARARVVRNGTMTMGTAHRALEEDVVRIA